MFCFFYKLQLSILDVILYICIYLRLLPATVAYCTIEAQLYM